MINKNFWDLLTEKQDSLTKSGTIIADYLTKHAEEAQFLSISSLAKACNMAEATIYRFCKQLGFEGYTCTGKCDADTVFFLFFRSIHADIFIM